MIRTATIYDMPVLIALARELVAESRFSDFGFIEAKCQAQFEGLIGGAGVIFIAEKDGEVVGGMACGKSEDWFSDIPLIYEFGVFVRRSHRGGFHGARLIKAYVAWARSLAPRVNINAGVTTGIDNTRVIGLYQALGLEIIGSALSSSR